MSIKVNNIFYTYGKKTPNETLVLNDITCNIKTGSFTTILGKTGSGKSTLIQHFNGLILPNSGSIQIDDFTIQSKKNKNIKLLRKHLGIVFQFPEYQLFEETVIKDVAFGPKNFGLSEQEAENKAKEALFSVGLNETYFKRSPFELSGGEKRRVAIAGIITIDPDILVLDEPTAGLDYQGYNDLLDLLKKMHEKGKTIIVVTHDMALVNQYASDVIVLKDGKVVFSGTPSQLYESNYDYYFIEIPPLYNLVKKLVNKGVPLNINEIKTIEDFSIQLKKWRDGK